ncbi:MAG: hypothetical protein KBA64_12180 [Armatimonadetes bacterium]|nr:hypothetical protein [Armatimonadota bacterium]MDI9603454.1 hypothetical protein [Acidobacteriota bacterium]NLN91404.1 hypothetical protein [candidate division WS1 bacterium]
MRIPLLVALVTLVLTLPSSAGDWHVCRALLPGGDAGEGEPLWEVDVSETDQGDLRYRVWEPDGEVCRGVILIAKRLLLPGALRGERPSLLPRIELDYTSVCEAEDASGYVGAFVMTQTEWDRYAEGDGQLVPWKDPERGLVRTIHEESDPDVTEGARWTGPRYPHAVQFLYEEPIYVGVILRGARAEVEEWTGKLQVRLSELRVPVSAS